MRTIGTAWYLYLPDLEILTKAIERSTFYKYIKDWCDARGVTRAQIGIITGARADLYFNGEVFSVSYDSIVELAKKGTDILFTEKKGLPDVLAEYANKYGIAMVNTRGKLTEYGKDLMEAIDDAGGHVAIMADYDASGVKIASETPTEVPWIGANDEMLEYFKLNRGSVAVASISEQNKDYVRDLVENGCHPTGNYVRSGEFDNRFKDVDIDFLDTQRVELDAILAAVGEERLFEYIKDKFEELYPERDYNRVIELDDLLLLLEKPDEEWGEQLEHEKAIIKIDDKIKSFTEPEKEEIKGDLEDYEGFLEVQVERKNIKERLGKVLTDDPDCKDFIDKLSELVKSHPFFTKESAGGN